MKTIFISFFLIFSVHLFSQAPLWTISNYTVSFKIKNAKLNVEGKFSDLKATINFDANKLNTSSIEAKVSASSIKTGIDMRDKHLKKKEYFDVSTFPEMTLKTIGIIKMGENQYGAKCYLSIKGKTKELTVPFVIDSKTGITTFNSTFTLNRLDFGIGSTSIIMANDLQVFLAIQASKS